MARREEYNVSGGGELTSLPIVDYLNTNFPGVQKRELWNTTSADDGLIYMLLPTSGTSLATSSLTLYVCNSSQVIDTFNITTRGTSGNGGAVTNGHIGLFTNTSDRNWYVYCYTYDIQNGTLTTGRQIATNRSYLTGMYYAFTYNGANYVCQTLNSSSNALTLINMDSGQVQVNQRSYQDYLHLFYNKSGDSSYPFLGADCTAKQYYNSNRPMVIRKYAFPPINDGIAVSDSIDMSLMPGAWTVAFMFKFYDVDDYFYIKIDTKAYTLKGDFSHIQFGNDIPSGYSLTHMNLKSGYGYFYNNSTYAFERYKISDFFNW